MRRVPHLIRVVVVWKTDVHTNFAAEIRVSSKIFSEIKCSTEALEMEINMRAYARDSVFDMTTHYALL